MVPPTVPARGRHSGDRAGGLPPALQEPGEVQEGRTAGQLPEVALDAHPEQGFRLPEKGSSRATRRGGGAGRGGGGGREAKGIRANWGDEPALPDAADEGGAPPPAERMILLRRCLELVRSEFEPRTYEAFWEIVLNGKAPGDAARSL